MSMEPQKNNLGKVNMEPDYVERILLCSESTKEPLIPLAAFLGKGSVNLALDVKSLKSAAEEMAQQLQTAPYFSRELSSSICQLTCYEVHSFPASVGTRTHFAYMQNLFFFFKF